MLTLYIIKNLRNSKWSNGIGYESDQISIYKHLKAYILNQEVKCLRTFEESCSFVALLTIGVGVLLATLWHWSPLLFTNFSPIFQGPFIQLRNGRRICICIVWLGGEATVGMHPPLDFADLSQRYI